MINTFNVCIGQRPFPVTHQNFVDLMIAPQIIAGPKYVALVEDSRYGPHGSALSEYGQLFWLDENLDRVAADSEFIRIFHDRRFVSPTSPPVGVRASDDSWTTVIPESNLTFLGTAFERQSQTELFNTPINFAGGVLADYAQNHVLEDILRFANFICQQEIVTEVEAAELLGGTIMIPACSIGVFRRETFHQLFGALRKAADFLLSPYFVAREGCQKQSVGFLLERLNSFMILKLMEADPHRGTVGYSVVISDSSPAGNTISSSGR